MNLRTLHTSSPRDESHLTGPISNPGGPCRAATGQSRPASSSVGSSERNWGLSLALKTAQVALLCFSFVLTVSAAEPLKTKNVILVTTDGLRWEEVFRGAEEMLINQGVRKLGDTNAIRKSFWRDTPEERREALFPFLWGTVAKHGQLWGNRDLGKARSARVERAQLLLSRLQRIPHRHRRPAIDSNDKILNANTNVFEWLHQPGFEGRVAAAVNWDVLPWILNGPRAGFPVWSGFKVPEGTERMGAGSAHRTGRTRATIWSGVSLDTFVGYAAKHACAPSSLARCMSPSARPMTGRTKPVTNAISAAHEFDRFLSGCGR
jgi:hypothetical protein